jgi:hypothetical protein
MDIVSKLQSIFPIDKQLHFAMGTIIGFSLALFIPWYFAFGVAVIVGALKELYDYYHPPHTCDFYDFLATAIGGGYVALLYIIKIMVTHA